MFGLLLRRKIGVEEKIKKLQNKYLEQLKVYRYRAIDEQNNLEIEKVSKPNFN